VVTRLEILPVADFADRKDALAAAGSRCALSITFTKAPFRSIAGIDGTSGSEYLLEPCVAASRICTRRIISAAGHCRTISAATKALASAAQSKPPEPPCFTCRPTALTSTRSRTPSQNLWRRFARPPPALSTLCGRSSAKSSTHSRPQSAPTTSPQPDTIQTDRLPL
jgi:hypothetical protein